MPRKQTSTKYLRRRLNKKMTHRCLDTKCESGCNIAPSDLNLDCPSRSQESCNDKQVIIHNHINIADHPRRDFVNCNNWGYNPHPPWIGGTPPWVTFGAPCSQAFPACPIRGWCGPPLCNSQCGSPIMPIC